MKIRIMLKMMILKTFYNERKCYGFDVLELPVDDNESIFSQCDENLSDIAVHSSSKHNPCYNQQRLMNKKKKQKRLEKYGSVLKLVPQEKTPLFKYFSPIKNIYLQDIIFPKDSNLFQENNIEEFLILFSIVCKDKRVTRTTYDKKKETFIVDIEDKMIYEKEMSIDHQSIDYYKDWIQSMGNKKGLQLLKILQNCIQNFKERSEATISIEDIPTIIAQKKVWKKKLDKNTKEWIKKQPFTRQKRRTVNQSKKFFLVEETISKNYLELIEADANDLDKLYDSFKTFEFSNNAFTKDYISCTENIYEDIGKQAYVDMNLQKPYVITQSFSTILKSSDGKNLYKGHHVAWNEEFIKNSDKYNVIYFVYIPEQKYENSD